MRQSAFTRKIAPEPYRLYWRWMSKAPVGCPKIDKEMRELIGKMSRENPLWGVPRIQVELRLLGYDLAESTVAKYRVRGRTSPSQTWKTFLTNHTKQIAAVDFFTVPTITFRNLYCFVVLLHDRRQVIHFNVTGARRPPGPRSRLSKPSLKIQLDRRLILNETLKVWVAPDWIIACMGRGRHAGLPPHRFAHRSKAGLSSLHCETTLTASTASTPKLASNLPRNRTKRYGVGADE